MPLPVMEMELMRRAREGDESAWRSIYDSSRDRLFALLVFHSGDREEALDLLQETFVAAWRGLERYRGEAPIEAWLAGIALRRARDWKRRWLPRRRRVIPLDPLAEPPDPHPFTAGSALLARRLPGALARLSERQRSVFLLHEWFGYSFDEIARLLGIGEPTARVHNFRARQALQATLGDLDVPPPAGQLRESAS